ncbi:MAG: hypothetical protein ACRD9S_17110 [Pyrinomonadaceae bacterium]
METLIAFLKHGSALDLLVILLVILITVIMIPAAIWIGIAARTRKPIYFLLLISLLPLVLALTGTALRYINIERALANVPDVSAEIVTAARQEAWITTYLGATGTVVIGLIGVAGLILKKERNV